MGAHETECNYIIVKCTAAHVLCPWTGLRSLLTEHVSQCSFIKLLPVLTNLLNRVSTLENRTLSVENAIDVKTPRKKAEDFLNRLKLSAYSFLWSRHCSLTLMLYPI
jgi:hypothetical protein